MPIAQWRMLRQSVSADGGATVTATCAHNLRVLGARVCSRVGLDHLGSAERGSALLLGSRLCSARLSALVRSALCARRSILGSRLALDFVVGTQLCWPLLSARLSALLSTLQALCCGVLRCVVLRCVVLRCVLQRCVVLHCFRVVFCCVVLCCVVL